MLRCDGVRQVRHRVLGRGTFFFEPKNRRGHGVYYLYARDVVLLVTSSLSFMCTFGSVSKNWLPWQEGSVLLGAKGQRALMPRQAAAAMGGGCRRGSGTKLLWLRGSTIRWCLLGWSSCTSSRI